MADSVPPLGLITDRYTRNARVYPALFVMAPVALCAAALALVDLSTLKSAVIAFGAFGGTYFLAHFTRDPGKNKQAELFQKWGGMPSVVILQHSDERIDRITKERCHRRLALLVEGTKALTKEQEDANPQHAKEIYSAWSSHLRNNTRDHKRFPLIFDELVAFGYRRSLLGLRPLGLTISVCCLVGSCIFAGWQWLSADHAYPRTVASIAIASGFVLIWLFLVSEKWVRLTADAYAERLIEATDVLHEEKPEPPQP